MIARFSADGSGAALAGSDATVLIDAPIDADLVDALAQALRSDEPFEALVDALVASGVSSLPALAVVSVTDHLRVLARRTAVQVMTAAGPVEVDGTDACTWVDASVSGATSVAVALGDAPDVVDRLLAPGALARASAIRLVLDDRHAAESRTAGIDPGATLLPDDVPDVLALSVAGGPTAASATPEPAPTSFAPSEPTPTGDGGVRDAEDELDESTIGIAEFRAQRASRAGSPSAPTVAGIICPSGHANPPYAGSCRNCGQTITDRAERMVPRPVMGELRFDDGRTVEITAPVLLGRKPSPQVIDGEQAILVELSDDDRLLSRTHAELHLDSWRVTIVDRASRNHTFVTPPSQAEMQLEPDTPCPVVPGTVIRLSESARCTFVVPRTSP